MDNVKDYINAVSDERRPLLEKLDTLIMEMYPNAKVVMSYKTPTYKVKTGWVALGYWKNGVSLYTNGPHNIAEFKTKYPTIKTGKGSINFKITDVISSEALKKVIKNAIENPKQSHARSNT